MATTDNQPERLSPDRWFLRFWAETERLTPKGIVHLIVAVLSVLGVFAVIYLALWGKVHERHQIAWFLLFLFPICFLTTSCFKDVKRLTWLDWLFAALAVATPLYSIIYEPLWKEWMSAFSQVSWHHLVFGLILSALVIELCRRSVGPGLSIIVVLMLLYVAFGEYLGGSFRHSGVELLYFIEMQTVTQDGIFGSPLYVTASYAFLFVLFGNFFVVAGGGQLFFDVAAAVTGRMSGGPAKACVMSSGLYGSISGSPVADVATTGPISIPIMKKIGISSERAGAIEAAASTGGSILPPVMGAVAFIMADYTGIPYAHIAAFAVLPALAYYFGVFTLVHFESRRLDLGRVPEDQIVGLKIALKNNWHSLFSLIVLIVLLVQGYSAAYVGAGSTLAVILGSWVKKETAIGPQRFVKACVETCLSMAGLIGAVAAAGFFIGCIELTGLAGKFTLLLFQLSGGLLIPSLILTAIVLILLGMGMPTTGVYIMGIALLAPVMVTRFGLPLMETHMFILFFSCMSAITPPVAVASFAAGAIAGASPMKIAPYACMLAVGGFLLPFFFMFNPGILLQGDLVDIVGDAILGTSCVFVASIMLHGYVIKFRLNILWRLLFFAAVIALIVPRPEFQWPALAMALGLFFLLRARSNAAAPAAARAH